MGLEKREKVLVSACLMGIPCRYDSSSCRNPLLDELLADKEWKSVCPEVIGGLPTPRPRAWIEGGDGDDVLDGTARVLNEEKADVTEQFVRGAREALRLARSLGAARAYLKSKSPSCGAGKTYGTGNKLTDGDGATAALFRREGIEIEVID